MAGLAGWLFGMASPMAAQVLVGLGFGFVTYAGIDTGFNLLVSQLTSRFGSVPPDIIVYAQMSGAIEAMGIVLGALAFKISLIPLSRLAKL